MTKIAQSHRKSIGLKIMDNKIISAMMHFSFTCYSSPVSVANMVLIKTIINFCVNIVQVAKFLDKIIIYNLNQYIGDECKASGLN